MLHIVSQYLRESALQYPGHPAFADNRITLTYMDALTEAEKIAFYMVSQGLFKKPVAVMMDKCARTVTAFLGIAMSGNYYSVIDDKMPQNRIEKILDTLEPELILIDKKNRKKAESLPGNKVIYEDLMEQVLTARDRQRVADAESRIIDTDILYVLFTSGSTGVPKGVIITHRSVIDLSLIHI